MKVDDTQERRGAAKNELDLFCGPTKLPSGEREYLMPISQGSEKIMVGLQDIILP
jgi:hypothetical protein